jgi:hypothetical protein
MRFLCPAGVRDPGLSFHFLDTAGNSVVYSSRNLTAPGATGWIDRGTEREDDFRERERQNERGLVENWLFAVRRRIADGRERRWGAAGVAGPG